MRLDEADGGIGCRAEHAPLRADACKIEFALHYEFTNIILEKIIGPVFSHIANTFVESFVKRADQRYGKA